MYKINVYMSRETRSGCVLQAMPERIHVCALDGSQGIRPYDSPTSYGTELLAAVFAQIPDRGCICLLHTACVTDCCVCLQFCGWHCNMAYKKHISAFKSNFSGGKPQCHNARVLWIVAKVLLCSCYDVWLSG